MLAWPTTTPTSHCSGYASINLTKMKRFHYICSLILVFLSSVSSFAPSKTSVEKVTIQLNAVTPSRRDFFNSAINTAGMISIITFTQPAYADVTNKIASQASLRYIKRSVKEFDKLELYASMNDYTEMKEAIRAPALSEIRKNAFVIIRGAEDGPESENLQASYKTFISCLEKLDSDSSLGLR